MALFKSTEDCAYYRSAPCSREKTNTNCSDIFPSLINGSFLRAPLSSLKQTHGSKQDPRSAASSYCGQAWRISSCWPVATDTPYFSASCSVHQPPHFFAYLLPHRSIVALARSQSTSTRLDCSVATWFHFIFFSKMTQRQLFLIPSIFGSFSSCHRSLSRRYQGPYLVCNYTRMKTVSLVSLVKTFICLQTYV